MNDRSNPADRPDRPDRPDRKPATKGITEIAEDVFRANLDPREHIFNAVILAEVAYCPEDDNQPTTYRRLRATDPGAHPGALESLARHTAEDLTAELRPSTDAPSGRMRVQRQGG